jgi:hypothetical protein
LFFSAGRAEDAASTISANFQACIGGVDQHLNQRAIAGWVQDNTANTESALAMEHDAVYVNLQGADTVDGIMRVTALGSDGFSAVMDDADPVAKFVFYLAIG